MTKLYLYEAKDEADKKDFTIPDYYSASVQQCTIYSITSIDVAILGQ